LPDDYCSNPSSAHHAIVLVVLIGNYEINIL